MTRKPDWADRRVERVFGQVPAYLAVRTNYQDCPAEYNPHAMVLIEDCQQAMATLLRKHHRRVVRMVRRLQRLEQLNAHAIRSGSMDYNRACNDILGGLEETTG